MQMIRDYSFSLVLSSNLSMKKKNHSLWWPMKGLKKCHDKLKKKKKNLISNFYYIQVWNGDILTTNFIIVHDYNSI